MLNDIHAAKFSRDGEIRLSFAFDSPERRLDVTVDDDGIGLGLAISRRLCRLMGGDLTYERRQPGGSRFRIDLPAEPASEPEAAF